jgi:hypothetical protein
MLRVLVGVFVIAHGLVTFGIWAAPVPEKAPFNYAGVQALQQG